MPSTQRQPSYRAAFALATALSVALTGSPAIAGEDEDVESAANETDQAAETPASTESDPDPDRSKASTALAPDDPPPSLSIDEARGPDVTLIAGEERTVYEYRQNGRLTMIKVVPSVGRAYYLAPRDPTSGFGDLEQADTLVPRWVLIEF